MSRSSKKGPYVDPKLLKKAIKAKETQDRRPIKTWSRDSVILPEFVGLNFAVYDGRKHIPIFITESMVGHKLGEFALTRTFKKHGGIKVKKALEKT